MNIIVLCLSQGYGGLELYVYREICFLIKQEIAVFPVVSHKSMLAQKLSDEGIDFYGINPGNKHLPIISSLRIAGLIKRNNIDLLHISWGKDLNLAAMAKYFSGKTPRLVYSRHMEITRSKKDILHRWFYGQVNSFLAISKMVEDNAYTYLPLAPKIIKLMYLGVAAPKVSDTNCATFFSSHGIRKRTINIALFGRVEIGKAQHIMLSALKMLVENQYDVSLSIIGHIMNKKYYSELIESVKISELSDYVYFTGMIEDVIDKMQCFDVIVLTTPKETFGLVLAEAMRAGVAVIGTNAGGVTDIIEQDKTGLLFEPGNPESLFKELSKLYDSPEVRMHIASEGKKKADNKFSEERHFQEFITLLKQ